MPAKTYDFPNAKIEVLPNRRGCREFPKWCPMIKVDRSRDYVARALRNLRRFHRGEPVIG